MTSRTNDLCNRRTLRPLASAMALACSALVAVALSPVLAPAHAQQPGGVEIVVKFKDDAKVKDIIDLFWRDEGAARARFAAFRAARGEFAGLRLERVTYSNELVLVPEGAQAPAAIRALARTLAAHPDISYADPNLTAHTGGQ